MPTTKYVGWDEVTAYTTATGSKRARTLLWGDEVEVISTSGARSKIRARHRTKEVFVDKDALKGKPLLEFYFIDVGQGDGTLIVTPERKHILIDGGYPRAKQNTGKSAADFVDWKFFHDYRRDTIELDAMICSHNDEDHYGGLADLLDSAQDDELDCSDVRVEKFFHAGLSWWKTPTKKRFLGDTRKLGSKSYYIDLLTSRTKAVSSLSSNANPRLQGMWARFIRKVTQTKKKSGGNTPFQRLSREEGSLSHLDGPDLSFNVLGPVETATSAGPGLQKLASASGQNTNGHSVLLRIDYDNVRVLLTGDLNKNSQRLLLEAYDGDETEFRADVAKACHHGSDDVSFEFLAAIKPAVTVISSGDAEGHDHPRPSIVGASGITGYLTIKDDEIQTPLVYSTELARSVSLGDPFKLVVPETGGTKRDIEGSELVSSRVHYSEQKPGALGPEKKSRSMGFTYVVAGQVYGLVNVRTDGRKILCATMNEGDGTWQIKTTEGRF